MPSARSGRPSLRTSPASSSQRQSFLELRRRGFTDSQLARVANTTAERIATLRALRGKPTSARQRLLIAAAPDYIADLIEQQEALALVLQSGLTRSDIAAATNLTLEGLKYWEGGERDVIKRATDDRRQKLLKLAKRVSTLVDKRPKIDLREHIALRSQVVGVKRPAGRTSGRRSQEQTAAFQEEMKAAGLWPPALRARTLQRMVAEGERLSGIGKSDWIRRLDASRTVFYKMLDPANDILLPPDLVQRIQQALQEQERIARAGVPFKERFVKVMTKLLGAKNVSRKFPTGDPKFAAILDKLSTAMGWTTRNARRYMPPYDKTFWANWTVSPEVLDKLEQLAARKGPLLKSKSKAQSKKKKK